jgi:hypothetical protein
MNQRRLVVCFVLSALSSFAQTARIAGRVTDGSGAIVPGTLVTVTNTQTGAEGKVVTNEEGYYSAPLLLPGEYRIMVEHAGFMPVGRAGVNLDVDQRAELDFVLEIGGVSERIDVTAAATQLNTVEGSQGQVIENRRVVELPLNGRNYDELALLSAGTVQAGVRLPAMPHLEEPTRSFSTTSPVLMSPRRLKRFAEQLFGQDPGGQSSDS